MRYGLFLPIFDDLADPALLGSLAQEAEEAGWDGVFFWDHVDYRPPVTRVTDPWTAMAVAADRTTRIRLGPMVTPLARRRPHVLARQVLALDQLSGGRFILGVGLGLDSSGRELSKFGEETDDRRRAAMLDEGLEVLTGLLSGQEVNHHGPHYTAAGVRFLPSRPHGAVPVWLAARWPNLRPIRRAAAHDGVFVIDLHRPGDLADAVAAIKAYRPEGLAGYEVAVQADLAGDPEPWAAAGATWWLVGFDPFTAAAEDVRAAIAVGPPSR